MRLKPALRVFVYGAVLALPLWAFWLEPASLRVREYDLPLAQWPASQSGLRVAVLSDIHAGAPYINADKLARIVALTLAAKPDLILLAGDYVTNGVLGGSYMPPEDIAVALAPLTAPLGVYAVSGNHEHLRDPAEMRAAFERHGIHAIDNRALRIEQGRYRFWLMGYDSLSPPSPRPLKILAEAMLDTLPVIALTHDPRVYPALTQRVCLLIAGHTHGGQVNLPLLGPVILRAFSPPQVYAAGHFSEGGNDLFVSSGIGTSNLPVRFRVPPEISVLTLRPAAESAP